jgi:hypothetical protein
MSATPELKTFKPKRYEVLLTRIVIVYGQDEKEAKNKALLVDGQVNSSRYNCIEIKEIPPDNPHGPEVDIAPARETRK